MEEIPAARRESRASMRDDLYIELSGLSRYVRSEALKNRR